MKILAACEESQAVTIELRKLGHEAYSCDIQECSGGYPEWHIREDVTQVIKEQWDMIIAFPPCTDLASAGAAWFEEKIKDGRQKKSIDFFMMFTDLECPKVAIENPVGIMSRIYRKPDQIIMPFYFGHTESKRTCLWLKGLPKLIPTNIVEPGEKVKFDSGRVMPKWYADMWKLKPDERAKLRSKTFPGVARAMAEQWTSNYEIVE